MSKSKLYQPPPGYYDMPFSWIYNLGNQPADGQDLMNQFVYLLGGYGDFILRRIVGQCRALKPYLGVPGGNFGRYQFYDRIKAPLEASPVFAWGIPAGKVGVPEEQDLAVVPELEYPETGRIGFDLYTLRRPPLAPNSAQIAFQGVRRMKGARKRRPDYRATPKSFTYKMSVTISDPYPAGPITRRVQIDDYDFELHNLIIQQRSCDSPAPFAGPEQVSPIATAGSGAFNWQPPTVFLHGSERWQFLTDTTGATWNLRANLRTNPSNDLNNPNDGSWTEEAVGPAVSNGSIALLQQPFACPTFIQDPLDSTKIVCCYARAADATIAIVLFDMVTRTFGVPITGGPVVHGVDLTFNGPPITVWNDDTGAKTCIGYRASDNKFVIAFQGPFEVAGGGNCLRPYYVTYDRTLNVWSVAVMLAGALEHKPYEAHGIVVDPISNIAHCTVIVPPSGNPFPTDTAYEIWHVPVSPDDTINTKHLMTGLVQRVREPLVGYPVLRPVGAGGTYELMVSFVSGFPNGVEPAVAGTRRARVVRGLVGLNPTWTVEQISTTRANSPGDGSSLDSVGLGIGPDGSPYAFWFEGDEGVDFFYRLWYSKGTDVGKGWSKPVLLFICPQDDTTDFLDKGAQVSVLPGLGFGIIGTTAFVTAAPDGFGAVDGVVYFEFDPCSMSAPIRDTLAALLIYDENKVQISSAPMLDIYCDGAPGGVYKNGAIVTPLYYRKDSQLQIDFFSQVEMQAVLPVILDVYLVGKQYIPC